jgi:shikimate kinase / 3-dehydroquinate synthase
MRHLVLSGMMGSGKSTLGPRLAARLGMPFRDLDRAIEDEIGMSVASFFATEGEAAFRNLEAAHAQRMLNVATPSVIAFGGGTVTRKALRRWTLERGVVVTLQASAETLAARIAETDRPLLAGLDQVGREGRLAALISERAEAYAECHGCVRTDDAPEAAIEEVLALYQRAPISVALGLRSYAVDVCRDAAQSVATTIADLKPSSVLFVTDANVALHRKLYLEALQARLHMRTDVVTLVPGEAHKNLAQVANIWDTALDAGCDRSALVVGIGGGVALDMAGFAASTLLRGIRWVALPTSLLAMVDASVGGKTAIDHRAGKNLIGTFHQPTRVCVDLSHLETLPLREHRAGLAEAVKVAAVGDRELFAELEAHAKELEAGKGPIESVVRKSIAYKARVVQEDEREGGLRALLNFGHTYGHALEMSANYTEILHGEAVAIGMLYELRAAEAMGILDAGLAPRLRSLLERLGLPVEAPSKFHSAALHNIAADKKRDRDSMWLPLPGTRHGARSDGNAGTGTLFRVPLERLRDSLNFGV